MDAKVVWVVKPRIRKPVEVEALWINALRIAQHWSPRWDGRKARSGRLSLRFRNPATGGLFDMDADHVPGKTDARIRPNEIVAVGGLPYPVLDGAAARGVVDLVEAKLLTPLGLRSLAREDPGYVPRYRRATGTRCGLSPGHGLALADWPVCGGVAASALQFADSEVEARARFLPPLLRHLKTAGLGHVLEVADGDPPHTPGGCPFQAWSLGNLIRMRPMVGDAPHAA